MFLEPRLSDLCVIKEIKIFEQNAVQQNFL